MEPRITPMASPTPTYWLDQIDVAVELPMGPRGETGPPGTQWIVGPGLPPTDGTYEEGTLFLSGSGNIFRYENGRWVNTGVDLSDDSTIPDHDHAYLPITGGTLLGPLTGGDATFVGNVVVPTPNDPTEAVNVEYLTTALESLNLRRFFGDPTTGYSAIQTNSWDAAEFQGIYRQVAGPKPPAVAGPMIGLVMKEGSGSLSQFVQDIPTGRWFTRTKRGGVWSEWMTLTPIVALVPPVDPPTGPVFPNGTLWIQTDTVI